MSKALLGCIADDFTGATDLANMLVRGGMRAVQTIGVPASDGFALNLEADALIVALKSRTLPADEAVAQSLAALEWLRAQGCRQFLFKYCSTFDSTDNGNGNFDARAVSSTRPRSLTKISTADNGV